MKNKGYANFGRQLRCITGNVEVVYSVFQNHKLKAYFLVTIFHRHLAIFYGPIVFLKSMFPLQRFHVFWRRLNKTRRAKGRRTLSTLAAVWNGARCKKAWRKNFAYQASLFWRSIQLKRKNSDHSRPVRVMYPFSNQRRCAWTDEKIRNLYLKTSNEYVRVEMV